MADRMLQFVAVQQRQPDKRGAADRRGDFDEIYRDFDTGQAETQSGRRSARRSSATARSASSAPAPAGWRRPSSCAAAATGCTSTTGTTASAG